MSDASQGQIASMKEASWAVIPGSVALREKRIIRERLRYRKETIRSAEIRNDRMVRNIVEVGADAGGELEAELSFGSWDDYIMSSLHAVDTDWTTPFSFTSAGSAGDAQFTAPSTFAAAGADFSDLREGQYVKITGAAAANNNGIFKIATINSATSLTFVQTTITNANSQTVTVRASMIRNASTQHSFLIEKWFSDINKFVYFPGCVAGGLGITLEARKIATMVMRIMGQKALASATTLDTSGTYDASTTTEPFNTTANVGTIRRNGSALATPLRKLMIDSENSLRGRVAIGHKFPFSLGRGRFVQTGSTDAYFEDLTLYDDLFGHAKFSFDWRMTDAANNVYIFTLPRIVFLEGDPNLTGNDEDVILPIQYEAERDPTTACEIQIDKLAA